MVGTRSSLYLAAELLRLRSGISIINVRYKGAAVSLTDLLKTELALWSKVSKDAGIEPQ